MTYQKITGPLMANSHPGSYCGQDAYSDMLVTESRDDLYNSKAGLPHKSPVGCGICVDSNRLQRSTNADKNRGGTDVSAESKSIVRRLTPLECERLQGFPDGWTDTGGWTDSKGKKHKEADLPRYMALGNSIALPFWQYLARRICAQYERDITMASLFDGIGGFPLVFSRCGATPVWASEIEEFPIAVTKKRFGCD